MLFELPNFYKVKKITRNEEQIIRSIHKIKDTDF